MKFIKITYLAFLSIFCVGLSQNLQELQKLQEEYKNVKYIKEHLRKKSEAQGVYGIKDDFNSKFFTWLSIILIIVAIAYFNDTSNVDDCADSSLFPGFKLCHCYTEEEILSGSNKYTKNCL